MHEPLQAVGKWLHKVVTGHNQYYGVPGNYAALNLFRHKVYWNWRRALMRRSQKGYVTWKKMQRITGYLEAVTPGLPLSDHLQEIVCGTNK